MILQFKPVKNLKGRHYVDTMGRTWFPYELKYQHEGQSFSIEFMAKDDSDANAIFETIKKSSQLGDRIFETKDV